MANVISNRSRACAIVSKWITWFIMYTSWFGVLYLENRWNSGRGLYSVSAVGMLLRKAHHAGSWYNADGKFIVVRGVDFKQLCREINLSCLTIIVGSHLTRDLDRWLGQATSSHSPARAIIAPYPPFNMVKYWYPYCVFHSLNFYCRHAGYSYSGSCGGFAYKQVDPSNMWVTYRVLLEVIETALACHSSTHSI